LAVHLKTRTGLDFSLLIHQIDVEIAVIEAGLDKLNRAPQSMSTVENDVEIEIEEELAKIEAEIERDRKRPQADA
jgi:hypothetical protein